MNKIVFLLLLTTVSTYSQGRYTTVTPTSFTPLSYGELSYAATQKRSQYNENENYLYSLKDWIRKLSSQVTVEQFHNRLQKEYNDLVKIENKDLAKYSKYLRQTEDAVKTVINDYNNYIRNNNYESSNQQNYESKTSWLTHPLFAQASDQHLSEDYAGAISNYSKYLEIDENNTDILFFRAMAKSNYGDKQGAINDYDKIIELNSNYPMQIGDLKDVYNSKVNYLIELERYREALPFANKALDLDKTNPNAAVWKNRGYIHYKLENYEVSIHDLWNAIRIINATRIEERSYLFYLRGLAYSKLGQKDKACKDLKKAQELGFEVYTNEIKDMCE